LCHHLVWIRLDPDMPRRNANTGSGRDELQNSIDLTPERGWIMNSRNQEETAHRQKSHPLKNTEWARVEVIALLDVKRINHEADTHQKPKQVACSTRKTITKALGWHDTHSTIMKQL